MRKIKLIMSAMLLCVAMPMSAVIGTTSFTVGNLAYHITSSTTVEVGLSGDPNSAAYYGKVTNVTIPSTVTNTNNGTTYEVTKIAEYGFTSEKKSDATQVSIAATADCSGEKKGVEQTQVYSTETQKEVTVGGVTYQITQTRGDDYNNYWVNPYLKTVTFASNCQITEIGPMAFVGCTALQGIKIPVTVETLGAQCFALCSGMTSVEFETEAQGEDLTQYTRIETIPVYCFIGCTSLTSLYLPEGIKVIQNRALQYCFNLATIHLPNTLVVIGSHFLCEDHALQSITIPANVKYIDGGFFHGCCGLTEVFMLGAPANLIAGNSGQGSRNESWGWNLRFDGDAVNGCTVWVYSDYLDEYKGADGWKNLITGDRRTTEDGDYQTNTNQYLPFPEDEKREIPARWVTACLWQNYTASQVVATFGEGTKVAYMTKAEVDKDGFSSHGASVGNMYNLTFTVQDLTYTEDNDPIVIKKHTPFMLKSANDLSGEGEGVVVYNALLMRQNGEADEISKEHHITLPVTDTDEKFANTLVLMGSYYPDGDYKLQKWEFYFKNPLKDGKYDNPVEGGMGFYRATMDNFTALKSGRCFWRVIGDPEVEGNGNAKLMVGMTYNVWEEETDGVEKLHVELGAAPTEAYTLSGQRVKAESLQKGVYIVNGKKVMIK